MGAKRPKSLAYYNSLDGTDQRQCNPLDGTDQRYYNPLDGTDQRQL